MRKTGPSYLTYAHLIFISATVILNLWAANAFTPINYPDTETYELPVLEFLSGAEVSIFVRPIGYPFFIGVIYKLFGAERHFVIYAQQLLGVAAYFLHFLAFRYFMGSMAASVVSFLATASGTLIFYEMAVLADFLNYFALLVSLIFFFRYYARGEGQLFLALSALAALAAYLIRPNSLILPALVIMFLLFEAVFGQGVRARRLKHLAVYAMVFVFALLLAGIATQAVTGRTARPVGVGAPTLLSRVAEHIDYGHPPHLQIKERYRVLRIQHQLDYGKDQFTADASAAYELMTEIECADPAGELEAYRAAARSAEARYGAHELSTYYFTIYDIFRASRCALPTINAIFTEISAEALLNDPFGYARSVVLSAWDYIQMPSADYNGVVRMQQASGEPPMLLKSFAAVSSLLEGPAMSGILLFVLAAGGAFYFLTHDRRSSEYRMAAFLAIFLAANYLSIAVFMNVLSPRYKLPVYWVQLVLVCLFTGEALRRAIKRN